MPADRSKEPGRGFWSFGRGFVVWGFGGFVVVVVFVIWGLGGFFVFVFFKKKNR